MKYFDIFCPCVAIEHYFTELVILRLFGKFTNINEEKNLLLNRLGFYITQSVCTDIKHHTVNYYNIWGKISLYKMEKNKVLMVLMKKTNTNDNINIDESIIILHHQMLQYYLNL